MPAAGQVLVRVAACGVCRTDLHIVDGELSEPKLPLVPGHQIVGTVARGRRSASRPATRVGIPWLGETCGAAATACRGGRTCATTRSSPGTGATAATPSCAVAAEPYALPLPAGLSDVEAAPLLCAGLIGYRALRMAGDAERLGLYGFGAAAHIVCQVARQRGQARLRVHARGRRRTPQDFARELGAEWAGDAAGPPPEELDAAILFAPVGEHVPAALRVTAKGGTVVCAGIHMSDIPSFPYELLWGERVVRSVANLTRRDGEEFLALAPTVPVRTHVSEYPLERANEALDDLRAGRISGSAVLSVS